MKVYIYLSVICATVALSIWFPKLMLNPGPLSQGHQEIKRDCASCHGFFTGIKNTGCISCHPADKIDQYDSADGKSGLQFHQVLKDKSCTACHTDHKGTDPALSRAEFDHGLLSANLLTRCNSCHAGPTDSLHALVTPSCGSCHSTREWRFSGSFDHDLITGTNKPNCASCHPRPADELHLAFQENCGDCHTISAWKPAHFDHSEYFVLDTDHNVKCTTCHTSRADFKIYSCYGCHEHNEPETIAEHNEEGIFNISNCAACHPSADEDDIRSRETGGKDRGLERIRKHVESGKNKESGKDRDDD